LKEEYPKFSNTTARVLA